ncbi:MAG: hypothetical protein KDD82_03120 [Planctomycetes bacterium]|nr:hypothetical protein [Planctomycetota bacterium]
MRKAGIVWVCALLAGSAGAGEPSPLPAILREAETTRALDRVLLAPRRFALRRGPNLQDLQAIVVCRGRRVEGGLRLTIAFEQLEGEVTRFEYGIEGGRLVRLVAAVVSPQSADPTLEARADLSQTPPQLTQRDARQSRAPVALPWRGDELGELFVLFVLAPLADCGLDALATVRVVQELSLLGDPEGCAPLPRGLSLREQEGKRSLELREGEQVSARVRFGEGTRGGEIARLEFTDGLYADPISEADYDALHHAAPLRLQPPPHYAATDALRVLQAAQTVYRARAQRAGTLAELGEAGLLEAELAAGQARGWRVELAISEDGHRWIARATPAYREEPACFALRHDGELVVSPSALPLDPDLPFPDGVQRVPRSSRW